MSTALAGAAKRLLFASGALSRRLARTTFPGVAVLGYHAVRADAQELMPFAGLHVTAAELEAHCRLLAATCQPITLGQWLEAEATGTALPPRPVVLTFDDGYRSVLRRALPVLARQRVPAVVFVISGASAQGRLTWYDSVARQHGEAAVEALKSAPAETWRAAVATAPEAGPDDPCALLTAEQVCTLAASGTCEIGGHSAHHPILARLTAEEQWREISTDRDTLTAWTGRAPVAFAYPNGRPGLDYGPETVAAVAAAGYRMAFTTRHGYARAGEPPLERSRLLMLAGLGPAELAHRLLRFAEAG